MFTDTLIPWWGPAYWNCIKCRLLLACEQTLTRSVYDTKEIPLPSLSSCRFSELRTTRYLCFTFLCWINVQLKAPYQRISKYIYRYIFGTLKTTNSFFFFISSLFQLLIKILCTGSYIYFDRKVILFLLFYF